MKLTQRIAVLDFLRTEISCFLENPKAHEWNNLLEASYILNRWFTEESVLRSFAGIQSFLEKDKLEKWIGNYSISGVIENPKRIGVIMAGNIPMVGFHDLLCVFVSGNYFVGKLSSDDNILIPALVKKMLEFSEDVEDVISFDEQLKDNVDAVIATGSNNSARYFEYYFGKYPNVIRKNRNAVAVLTGQETAEELDNLGQDIFAYHGLGCRNVSKLYLPKGYNIDAFYEGIYKYKNVIEHNKYNNNYSYNRTVYLMQTAKFYDNNFLLLKEDNSLTSPIGTVNFEIYSFVNEVKEHLLAEDENIQCVVSKIDDIHPRRVGLGEAQNPGLDDYADGVDTLQFLVELRN
jgi:hypothetical protein